MDLKLIIRGGFVVKTIITMLITSMLVAMFAFTGVIKPAKAQSSVGPSIYPTNDDPTVVDPDPTTPQVTPDPNDPEQTPITQEEMDQAVEDATNEILANAPSAEVVALENSTYPEVSIAIDTDTGPQFLSAYSLGTKLIKKLR